MLKQIKKLFTKRKPERIALYTGIGYTEYKKPATTKKAKTIKNIWR